MIIMFVLQIILSLVFLHGSVCVEKGSIKGCYKTGINFVVIKNFGTLVECLDGCRIQNNYRYALYKEINSECACANLLGIDYDNKTCDESCNKCSIFYTGNLVPTAPENLSVTNVTNTTAVVSWEIPKFYLDIKKFQLKANAIKSYASYLGNPQWEFSNNTFTTELGSLNPGTEYKLILQAISSFGDGDSSTVFFNTLIGNPDNIPHVPQVKKRDGSTITVALNPVQNNNGPVSFYYVVVTNTSNKQIFQPDLVKSFNESKRENLGYYITAVLKPDEINNDFVVGDRKYYGNFYNAPLDPNSEYFIIEGMVSESENITKIVYSNVVKQFDFQESGERKSNNSMLPLKTALIICISILIILIVSIVVFYVFMRNKKMKNQLVRLRDNQELSVQGPILEIVNEGYFPEDEIQPVNHYDNLKQKIWRIPQNFLRVDNVILGAGDFGSVHCGSVKINSVDTPATVVAVYDKKLSNKSKKNMLRELDLLIKNEKHNNVVSLLGLCESVDVLFVVLECTLTNLKDLLLGSRNSTNGKISTLNEQEAISFMIDIANGILHLHKCKIFHKRLCSRNILITQFNVAKIGGYGLSHYSAQNVIPDYTRWTSVEVLDGQFYSDKSDVWSLACILWEISALGATPYGQISNSQILNQLKKGFRLPHLQYIGHELYQLMFDCWQFKCEDRPYCSTILENLIHCQNNYSLLLNFKLYPNFQYENFYVDSELVAKNIPVF